ncbi:hypothetical protein OHC33_010790 [Knufia fluminis]|uniref:S-adenosyl-L-methionine-dependent methyltransferase n=1 Tax=Knufia fluminis TaxID=191047 RepID=A0AAN8I159_9EURO|nr:hypothetical protein OHC33_010790 [Knufia fluminis]
MAEPTTDNQATSSGTETDGHNSRQAQLTTENLNALEANRQGIEADSANGDSAYGESTTSSFLTSIASEVTKGLYENGRRYHSFGTAEYGFPNDEPETDRLDMQHAMMTSLMSNRLFWAPINPNPLRVLDLGTGTGIWAIDFAEIQPSWVPPNCRFEIDDVERDWTYATDSFDFIHARNLICSVRDWPKLIAQTYEHVKPGGYVEWQMKHPFIVSDDGTLPENSALQQWSASFGEAADAFGTSLSTTPRLKEMMLQAGFVDVEEYVVKLPIGPWPKNKQLKRVGAFELVNMVDGVEGLTMRLFSKALGMPVEEIQMLLMNVRKEAKNSRIHSYYPFYIVFGRKPER